MNIICLGDSITFAGNVAEGDRWPTILHGLLDERLPGLCKVWNRGVGGNTTSQGMERVTPSVLPLLPGLLICEFGFNDAYFHPWANKARVGLNEFRDNLGSFHQLALDHDSTCVFIVNHTIDTPAEPQCNGKFYDENYAPYTVAIREVAKALAAPAIDLPCMMIERGLVPADIVTEDGIHLTADGNRHYAEMVDEGLKAAGLPAA